MIKFNIGDRVILDLDGKEPFYGYAGTHRGDVGVVRKTLPRKGYIVCFPAHPGLKVWEDDLKPLITQPEVGMTVRIRKSCTLEEIGNSPTRVIDETFKAINDWGLDGEWEIVAFDASTSPVMDCIVSTRCADSYAPENQYWVSDSFLEVLD